MQKLYEIPSLYDLAFWRNRVAANVDALIECHRRFRKDHTLERVLELAAGPGRHALEFAARDCKAAILDCAPGMCQYASHLAGQHSLALDVYQANMKDFAIPHKYDLAVILLNSIGHVHTHDDLVQHLQAVARHLNEDGVYVIEGHYPPWTDGENLRTSSWSTQQDQLKMHVEFGLPDDQFDQDLRIRKVHLHIFGHLKERTFDFIDHITIRSWTSEALEEAFRQSGAFEVVCKSSQLDPSFAFGHEDPAGLVYVLRRLD